MRVSAYLQKNFISVTFFQDHSDWFYGFWECPLTSGSILVATGNIRGNFPSLNLCGRVKDIRDDTRPDGLRMLGMSYQRVTNINYRIRSAKTLQKNQAV